MRTITLADLPTLVGQELGVSDWVEIDQTRIDLFAAVTEDHQWIHVDVERARREFGGTIAHGFLSLSLLSAMTAQIVDVRGVRSGLNTGFDRVRFTCPVAAGSRVRLRLTLTAAEPIPAGLALKYGCVVEIEGGEKPALVADWLTRLYG